MSRNAAVRAGLDPEALPKFAELMEPRDLDVRLPGGAVHQVHRGSPCRRSTGRTFRMRRCAPRKPLVILDQVTDPQNVGAVFRSAAAFGIAGVVMQTRNSPLLGGALARGGGGAIEQVDDIRAVNISRAIDELTDAGWRVIGARWVCGTDAGGGVRGTGAAGHRAGRGGAGIRQGDAEGLARGWRRSPWGEGMESLNVSNAAAIAFYEAQRRRGAAPPPAKAALPPSEDEDGAGDETDQTVTQDC